MESIDARVRAFINENFPSSTTEDEYPAEQSLLESGIIDSMGVLSLVMWLEETFEIVVDDDEVLPENLDSIAGISAFVERKLKEKHGDHAMEPAA